MSPNPEADLYSERITRAIGRVIASVDLLTAEQVLWQPPIAGWNNMAAILWHLLANVEDNICGVIGGDEMARHRDEEFDPPIETAGQLRDRWFALEPRVRAVLANLGADEMGATRKHRWRGEITVREVLMVVVAHVGQHEGHAQMTRDYLLARGPFVD